MGFFDKIKDAFDGDDAKHGDARHGSVTSPFDPNSQVAPDQPVADQPAADEPTPDQPLASEMPTLDVDLSSLGEGAGTDLPLDGTEQLAAEPQGEVPPAPEAIPAEEAPAVPAPEFPPAAPEAPTAQAYEVVEGDNLTWIGERFGVSVEQLVQANNIENPDLIYPGQVLTIPQS